ncbi:hypothetical protein KSP39_PZI005032 [Platanthera zijinensis]|uniref:Uncharacterized protein n=1 Tax=Platanthera zijinensis TaxID=2320716 RepID=A0AAP0BSN3_9ASPA
MEFASIQYLVSEIDYVNKLIRVTDVTVLSSNCSLPLKFLPSHSIDLLYYRFGAYDYHVRTYFRLDSYDWVSIVKCSKKLSPEYNYQLIPCQTTKDSYVYGVFDTTVASLAPSCSFLSWMPITYDPLINPNDIFLAFRRGFYMSWEKPNLPVAMIIRYCLRRSSW